jgi:hypothetical protein
LRYCAIGDFSEQSSSGYRASIAGCCPNAATRFNADCSAFAGQAFDDVIVSSVFPSLDLMPAFVLASDIQE